MATTLKLSKSKGTLECFGKAYAVTSGIPGQYEPVPLGTYTIPTNSLMVGTKKIAGIPYDSKYAKASYCDKKGFGWFLWIGKGNLGIHPDGNVPGTKGCIGLTAADTRPIFDEFSKCRTKPMTLIVSP